jgi:hypothetical protein
MAYRKHIPSAPLRTGQAVEVSAPAGDHRLDNAAQYFFASLKSYLELGAGSRHVIVSGHDIERWLLKTAEAAAVSKHFARGRERLSGAFSRDEAILDMLDSPRQWPDGAGLYCIMNTE